MNSDEKPRLIPISQCPDDKLPNVLIVSGFPWYITESDVHRYLCTIFPSAAPSVTRLYANPINGSSRGHCFVEYQELQIPSIASPSQNKGSVSSTLPSVKTTSPSGPSAFTLADVKEAVDQNPYGKQIFLVGTLYFLNNGRWDRNGRLPELPTDPPLLRRAIVGYGDEGFSIRCGSAIERPNTVIEDDRRKLKSLRKRWRDESRVQD